MRYERKLNEREELILQTVVHHYITSAEPAGSRALVKRFGLEISPATVRNVMADLEEMGFLQRVHTSSGRVPTNEGYRYYVDYLMRVQEITHSERARIESNLTSRLNDADEVLRQTSHLLALISHHTGIVEAPSLEVARIQSIRITMLDERRAALLVVDNYGRVRTIVIHLDGETSGEEVDQLNRFLVDELRGTSVARIRATLQDSLQVFLEQKKALAQRAMKISEIFPAEHAEQVFLEGATQLFEQPEFRDIERAREVFGLLEERDLVMELLRAGSLTRNAHESRVLIGSESSAQGADEISVVSAPYRIGGETVGMLGVLGPRRMQYSRLTGIVEYTASKLSSLLTRLAQ